MAVRKRLLYCGDSFEYTVMDVVRAAFPDAILLHNRSAFSAFLDNDTQIDVIAISSSGVFVIEAKNWAYWIKGTYDDYQWTGKSRDQKIMTVFNPVHQNFIHIRTIRNALRGIGLNPPAFQNIVVVPDGTEIVGNCEEVVNLSVLPRRIKSLAIANSINVQEMKQNIMKVTR